MDQNIELLEYLYQDAEMGTYTITQLLRDLKEKDNHIKSTLEDVLKGYETYQKIIKERIKQNGAEVKPESRMAKMGSKMGIKKEVLHDNSDAAIADMMIQGLTMGTTDVQKRIHNFDEKTSMENQKLAQDILKFEEDSIEQLKKFL